MDRRTILKRLGAASVGAAGLSATTSAENSGDGEAILGSVDRTIDVSDESGTTPLTDLLTDAELQRVDLDADVDPWKISLQIGEEQSELSANAMYCDMGCCSGWDGTCPNTFYCNNCYCANCTVVIGY